MAARPRRSTQRRLYCDPDSQIMFVTAIIAAGGRGQRFGSARPKQLIEIGGEPMLARSVRAFATHPSISEVIAAGTSRIGARARGRG